MFTNIYQNQNRQNIQNNNISIINNKNNHFLSLMNNRVLQPNVQQRNIQREIIPEKPSKKMEWGEPTWFLFHTLAEKVKEEEFPLIRTELLNIIYSICSILPCPMCSSHAKTHLNGSNFNNIRTKQQLKDFLFLFHNTVNQKKNYLLFDYNNLNEKYSKANTDMIIRNFLLNFKSKNHNNLMIADDFHRKRTLKDFELWLNKNIYKFNR